MRDRRLTSPPTSAADRTMMIRWQC